MKKGDSVAMTMYSVTGPSISLGYGEQHYESDSVTYNNSQLLATNINLNVANNADFAGANINANDTLNLNVGNDLNIESKRNANNSNSNGFNLSAGFGIGGKGNVASANGSVGANTGRTKVKQTVLSSVTGNNVNVNVGNNTHLKGLLLASGEYDNNGNFIDNGNLDFSTKTISFSNSTDSVYSSNNSFNVGTNVGFTESTTLKDPQADNNASTKENSTNLVFSNGLGYQRAKTLATLGNGNITITDIDNSDDITSLNRDTENISKTMVNVDYGVSVDATLDHRLLSEDGRKQIAEDFVKSEMIIDVISQIATNETVGITDFFGEVEKSNTTYEAIKAKISQDKSLVDILNSKAHTIEQKEVLLNTITQEVMVKLGYERIDTKLISTDENGRDGEQVKGFYSLESNSAYVNDKYNLTNEDLVNTSATEAQRAMDAQDGSKFDENREARSEYSQNFGNNVVDYTNFALNYTDQGSISTQVNQSSNVNQITTEPSIFNNSIANNNIEFEGLDKNLGDNLTIFVHGTDSSPEKADKDFIEAVGKTYNEKVYQFGWSGGNTVDARVQAGLELSKYIENYEFKPGELLNIVTHSHGGNVLKSFTQVYQGNKKIDNAVNLGTPNRSDFVFDYTKFENDAIIKNVYDGSDMVQIFGGNFIDTITGNNSREIDNPRVQNIEVEVPNVMKFSSVRSPTGLLIYGIEEFFLDHIYLDTKEVWEKSNDNF